MKASEQISSRTTALVAALIIRLVATSSHKVRFSAQINQIIRTRVVLPFNSNNPLPVSHSTHQIYLKRQNRAEQEAWTTMNKVMLSQACSKITLAPSDLHISQNSEILVVVPCKLGRVS